MSALKLSKPPTYLQYFQRIYSPNKSDHIFSIEQLFKKIKWSPVCKLVDILRGDFQFSLWDKQSSYGGFISTIEIHTGWAGRLPWSTWGPEETFGH